jgi:hypothetical protein
MGYDVPGNSAAAAGQFTADGKGNIPGGVVDLNDSPNGGNVLAGLPFTSKGYSISGSARGTIAGPSGITYNVYLTDPHLNLLDANNTSGGGGALLLETDATYSATGMLIPQIGNANLTITATSVANNSATAAATTTLYPAIDGGYALLLSNQNGSFYPNGGLTGEFVAPSTSGPGTFTGEGDYMGTGPNNGTPTVSPISGAFSSDPNYAGRFTGTMLTPPGYPNGGTSATTENFSLYMSGAAQGFAIETDKVAPTWGILEIQNPSPAASLIEHQALKQMPRAPAQIKAKQTVLKP